LAGSLAGVPASPAPAAESERWCDLLPRAAYGSLERIPVSDDWFQVYKVAAGVYAIYEPYQFQEVISYLILGSESAVLFDTGMGIGRIGSLVEGLTRLPVRVVNSHTHFDHVGGNADFDTVLGMDTAYTRRSAAGMPHDKVRGEVAPESLCRSLPQGFDAGLYRIRPFRIGATVKDGDVLDLGGRRLEVLAVPGHTPDALALLDRENGLLWTGDTFYEGEIWLFVPETDLAAYRQSIRRLAALAPQLRLLLTAHNTPVAEPRRLVDAVRAFESVQDSSARAHPREGDRVEYRFEGFSFLLKAPLSRESFEQALEEGASSLSAEEAGPRFAGRAFLWRDMVLDIADAAIGSDRSRRWIDLYVETPYTRARLEAYRGRKAGGTILDEEALWNAVTAQTTFRLWVRSVLEKERRVGRDRDDVQAEERAGVPVVAAELEVREDGAVRRLRPLEDRGSPPAPAFCSGGEDVPRCVSFVFPAAVLKSVGRVRAVLELEGYEEPVIARLKRSALRRP
jgi:glyoxylase-like metal-dependent hydrolase (beta-lactamase superfamily II)